MNIERMGIGSFVSFMLCILIALVFMQAEDAAQRRLVREAATLPDVRVIGKITESEPVNDNTVRLRLDDGTTLTLETRDVIPAGVTAVLRRTGESPPGPEGLAVPESTEYDEHKMLPAAGRPLLSTASVSGQRQPRRPATVFSLQPDLKE